MAVLPYKSRSFVMQFINDSWNEMVKSESPQQRWSFYNPWILKLEKSNWKLSSTLNSDYHKNFTGIANLFETNQNVSESLDEVSINGKLETHYYSTYTIFVSPRLGFLWKQRWRNFHQLIKLRSQETLKSSHLENVFFFFCGILMRPFLVMHTQNITVFSQEIMT